MKNRKFLLLIALFLSISTVCIGLSNTLWDVKDFSRTARLAHGDDFGITLSANDMDEIVYPGQEVNLAVTVTNNESVSTYLIATIDITDGLTVDDGAGINSQWTKLEEDKAGSTLSNVYYYGSDNKLSIFKDSTMLSNKVTVDAAEVLPAGAPDINYGVDVTVWAFQVTDETKEMSPADLWEEAKGV